MYNTLFVFIYIIDYAHFKKLGTFEIVPLFIFSDLLNEHKLIYFE